MNFSLVYIFSRLFFRIKDFFHHWYVDATRYFFHGFISFLENLDRTLAFRMTLRHLFEPLYKDYTIMGRILGPIFRFGRALVGFVVYVFVGAIFLTVYLLWLLLPVAALALAVKPTLG
jgi:hypothetical protein